MSKMPKSIGIAQIGIALAIALFLLGLFHRDITNDLIAAFLIGVIRISYFAGIVILCIIAIRGKR